VGQQRLLRVFDAWTNSAFDQTNTEHHNYYATHQGYADEKKAEDDSSGFRSKLFSQPGFEEQR
jgi:hypothetical protein